MKLLSKINAIKALFVLMFSGMASAAPITFVDVYDPVNTILTSSEVFTFTHDINDDGFNSSTDTVLSASLELIVRDDSLQEGDPPADPFRLTLDALVQGIFEVNLDSIIVSVVPLMVEDDGLLNVRMSLSPADGTDFVFASSVLTVEADRVVATVSEPNTIALMLLPAVFLLTKMRRRDFR